jgi:hypothetical protein
MNNNPRFGLMGERIWVMDRSRPMGGEELVDVWADGCVHLTPCKVGKGIRRPKSEPEGRARNRIVQEAVRAIEARIGRIQQLMEQSEGIGAGRWIARTLEDSREKGNETN